MLLENDIFINQFSEEKMRGARVLELIKRISITNDPSMDQMGYTEGTPVEIDINDGSVLFARGTVRDK